MSGLRSTAFVGFTDNKAMAELAEKLAVRLVANSFVSPVRYVRGDDSVTLSSHNGSAMRPLVR